MTDAAARADAIALMTAMLTEHAATARWHEGRAEATDAADADGLLTDEVMDEVLARRMLLHDPTEEPKVLIVDETATVPVQLIALGEVSALVLALMEMFAEFIEHAGETFDALGTDVPASAPLSDFAALTLRCWQRYVAHGITGLDEVDE